MAGCNRFCNVNTFLTAVAGSSHHHQNQPFNPTQTHFNQHTTGTPKSDVDTSSSVHTAATITTTSSSSAGAGRGENSGGRTAGSNRGATSAALSASGGSDRANAAVTPTNMPPLKKKTTVVKQSVPPPVPPRGSPKFSKGAGGGTGRAGGTGSLPSQSSGHRGRSSAGKQQRNGTGIRHSASGHDRRGLDRNGHHQPPKISSPACGASRSVLDPLQEICSNQCASNESHSPNKVLSWLSSNDFRISENGDNLSIDGEQEQHGSTVNPATAQEERETPPERAIALTPRAPKVVAFKRKPMEIDDDEIALANVREARESFERRSSRNHSGSSVQRMIRSFERNAAVAQIARSESMLSRVPSHLSGTVTANKRYSTPLPITIPIIRETLVDDENNNGAATGSDLSTFVPMAEQIEQKSDLATVEDDRSVLANLKNVVKARREQFLNSTSSPVSTLERPIEKRHIPLQNGSLPPLAPKAVHLSRTKPSTRSSVRDREEIQRKIEQIEAEIRANEARLKGMPATQSKILNDRGCNHANDVPTTDTNRNIQLQESSRIAEPTALRCILAKNDSFLARLKPKSAGTETKAVDLNEKASRILQLIGLPLDDNHNVESYLEQFSLEGEFV